jgi:hypothetical protein
MVKKMRKKASPYRGVGLQAGNEDRIVPAVKAVTQIRDFPIML